MDTFVEQLIKKKSDKISVLKNLFIIMSTIGLLMLLIFVGANVPFMATFSFFVCIGLLCFSHSLIRSQRVEYEYALTNNDFTVDKIIDKKRRKHVISLDLRNIQDIGVYSQARKINQKLIKSCESEKDNSTWFINFRDSSLGNVTLLFSPNRKILNSLKPFLKGKVFSDVIGGD